MSATPISPGTPAKGLKFADVIASATRTPSQEAAAEIDRQLSLLSRQARQSMKTIKGLLDGTLDMDGKTKLTRAHVLAEFGDRAPAIQAALDQIGVPPPPLAKPAATTAPAGSSPA